jgi:hypothetical protein
MRIHPELLEAIQRVWEAWDPDDQGVFLHTLEVWMRTVRQDSAAAADTAPR